MQSVKSRAFELRFIRLPTHKKPHPLSFNINKYLYKKINTFSVDKGQLPKLEKAIRQTVHSFQFGPAAQHMILGAGTNANLPFRNTAIENII